MPDFSKTGYVFTTDMPNPPPDDDLEDDAFEDQKERVDRWLEEEKTEREAHDDQRQHD